MYSYELDEFATQLAKVRDYLATLASLDKRYPIGASAKWIARSDEAAKILELIEEFPSKLTSVQRASQACGRDVSEDFKIFLDKSDFQRKITRISTKIRIAKATGEIPQLSITIVRAIASLFHSSNKGLFQETGLDLEELISDTNLLRSKIILIRDLNRAREYSDEESFKPTNIDGDRFVDLLEEAMKSVTDSSAIPESLRKQLITYLESAKTELYKDKPSWKNIIGILVIASAIVSGFADAPEAASNLKKAFDYVVGQSIFMDQYSRPTLPYVPPTLHLNLPPKREEVMEPENEES